MENELLKHEINNLKDEIKELKSITAKQETEIQDLKSNSKVTNYQYEQIMESLKILNEKTIPNLTAQIEELKNKPVKRYDQVISGILGAIAGAIGASIVAIFKK